MSESGRPESASLNGPEAGDGEYVAPPSTRRRRRGCGRLALVALAVLLLWAGWEWLTWPDVAGLAERSPETSAFIERARRQGDVAWTWVSYDRISPHLKRAVLVSEDIGFHSHDGFERAEMKTALREAWAEKELPRGASTITQQVAKNLWLSSSYNPLRKVEEALLTRQLERHLSKRRILEIYLNVAEFGPGVFGAEAAARRYYGTSAAGLGEWQAAQLAAALSRPRSWYPGVTSGGYRWKTNLILGRMRQAGWLWRVI